MAAESYTPGHSANATEFMAQRSLDSHGAFFSSYLRSGLRVLDCGCGPGSITHGIAKRIAPGEAVGVDFGESQVARAGADAEKQGLANVKFVAASCYALPFADGSFDCVFAHALVEHLAEPQKAFAEFHRVLKVGGFIGVCSPDWGGFILAPDSPQITAARNAYTSLQTKNGGDVNAGRKLGGYLQAAGFTPLQMVARYECYPSLKFIGEYLALQLHQAGHEAEAQTFRTWSQHDGGLFAQSWVSAVGRK